MDYQIFLSSCFDNEMQQNREIFRADLIARFNERSGQFGDSTYITDFEYGIPDGLKAEQIIDICVSNIKKADLFMCILGRRYGYKIERTKAPMELLDFRDLLIPRSIQDNMISFFEIEILTALLFMPERTSFLVWNTSERDERADRLLDALIKGGYDIRFFETRDELANIAVDQFAKYSGYINTVELEENKEDLRYDIREGVFEKMQENLTVSQMQYLSRKLRYSIPQETIISRISAYVDSTSSDTLALIGDTDCGKSMALAEWIRRNIVREDISIHCWFHEEGAGILSVALMELMKNEEELGNFFYQDDVVHAFYNIVKKQNDIKQVFILDGIDHLRESKDFGWLITGTDPTVKIIITLNHSFSTYLPKEHVTVENIYPISTPELIKHIYTREGKELEYPYIQKTLVEICKDWSLRQVTDGIQQFLRIMKYQPGSSNDDWDTTKIREYLGEFSSPYGIFSNTKIYLENNFNTDIVHQSISFLALTERGLTRAELSDLMHGRIEIFYQLYFVLIQNEDLYMLPKDTVEQQISNMSKAEILRYRRKLINYFDSVGSDRAIIELCWQLVMLSDKEKLVEFLSSINNWGLIHTNSSLYFAGIDRALTAEQWDHIVNNWKKQLVAEPDSYSEKEVYAISDSLHSLCRTDDAINTIKILIDRGADAFSMASYHQQIAELYDDLGDERAIDHIEQAIHFLEIAEDTTFVQDRIDTYLTGAHIYSFFWDKKENTADKEKYIIETLERWLQKAIQLTEQVSYVNPNYLVICYHNVAYVYWNINRYDQALKYINYAISISRPDKSLTISDLELRAQICNDIFCNKNEGISEEIGVLTIAPDSDNKYLKLAGNDIKTALDLQKQLKNIQGKASYYETLAGLHYVMSQNMGYRGYYKEAMAEIDKALKIEIENDIIQDIYITYYQATIVGLGAYHDSRDKKFLKNVLIYLNRAEEEIIKNGTTNAHFYLDDVVKIKEYVIKELNKPFKDC